MCFSGFTDGFVCVRLCMNVFLWIHRRVRVCSSLHECVSLDSQTGLCVCSSLHECVSLDSQTGSCVFVSA